MTENATLTERLLKLASPDAEYLPDGVRLTEFVKVGIEAATALAVADARIASAEDAEYATKDLFWVVYEKYLEMGGKPVPTTNAGPNWRLRAETAETLLEEARRALEHMRVSYVADNHLIVELRKELASTQKALAPFANAGDPKVDQGLFGGDNDGQEVAS